MHKRLVNQCLIDVEIHTLGPLLIKSGVPWLTGPDMAPVVTFRNRARPEPYIPGSSLKGVLRSHTERVARTLCWDPAAWHVGACNPFLTDTQAADWRHQGACGAKFQEHKKALQAARKRGEQAEDLSSARVYRDSCPACQVFGSTSLIGRLAIPDAYVLPDSPYRSEQRDGVGIDRFTGGAAAGAKFDLEVVTNATFWVQLHLVNFELWQLGLLAYVLRDFSAGLVGIGSGKSRGLGQVNASIQKVQVSMVTRCLPRRDEARLWGLVALEPDDAGRAYKYWPLEREGVTLEGAEPVDDPLALRTGYVFQRAESVTALWHHVAPLATRYLEEYEMPADMRR